MGYSAALIDTFADLLVQGIVAILQSECPILVQIQHNTLVLRLVGQKHKNREDTVRIVVSSPFKFH